MATRYRIVGECMIELSGAEAGLWRMGFAGDSLNTLWALRALTDAVPADYVSAFGDDPFSRDQMAFFAANGIGIASSPSYQARGRGYTRSRWPAPSAPSPIGVPTRLAQARRRSRCIGKKPGEPGACLFFRDQPGNSRAACAGSAARRTRQGAAQGSLIAFDPNFRPRLWANAETARATVIEALQLTDIALPTFPDEKALFGDGDPQATAVRIEALGAAEIVVKNGEAPALVCSNGGQESVPAIHVPRPSIRPAPAIPSTAPISRPGLPASSRSRPLARPIRWRPPSCRCAARWRRSRCCGKRSNEKHTARFGPGSELKLARKASHASSSTSDRTHPCLNRYSVVCR